MSPIVQAGYRECRRIARRAASNFAWAFWCLQADQRRGMEALYAFARRTDDIADGDEPLDHRRAGLARWRGELRKALAGHAEEPALAALNDTVTRFVVPQHLLWRILDGVEMDLDGPSFATYAELRRYCEHVASAVGLACLPIWGCRDDDAILPAADCGVAFQLTNILRDLREDGMRGRVYLPHDELARFGVAPVDWLAPPGTYALRELIEFQCRRAAGLFESGQRTERFLDNGPRCVFRIMWGTYRSLLARIERDPLIVLRQRVRVSQPRKLMLAARTMLARS